MSELGAVPCSDQTSLFVENNPPSSTFNYISFYSHEPPLQPATSHLVGPACSGGHGHLCWRQTVLAFMHKTAGERMKCSYVSSSRRCRNKRPPCQPSSSLWSGPSPRFDWLPHATPVPVMTVKENGSHPLIHSCHLD